MNGQNKHTITYITNTDVPKLHFFCQNKTSKTLTLLNSRTHLLFSSIIHHTSKHAQHTARFHTPLHADGWGTHAQFGPDILGQYNTQLLSLITLAGTIKPHRAIAHASQGANLCSLLQRHLFPSQGHSTAGIQCSLERTQPTLTGWCACCPKEKEGPTVARR